jgi:hypothetical protein
MKKAPDETLIAESRSPVGVAPTAEAGNAPTRHGRIPLTRRRFLFQMASAGAGTTVVARAAMSAADHLQPLRVYNPLSNYPNRDWERVYRDLYASDSSFVFLCAPNDTHNCLLRGHVKNGVVTRISPTYGYSRGTDLAGNRASQRWDPRCCQKGLALVRRFADTDAASAPWSARDSRTGSTVDSRETRTPVSSTKSTSGVARIPGSASSASAWQRWHENRRHPTSAR